MNVQNISMNFETFRPTTVKGTALTAAAILSLWFAYDPTNIVEKIVTTAVGALALQTDILLSYISRQQELASIGKRELHEWENSYKVFKSSKEGKELARMTFSDFSNKEMETSERKWGTADEFRSPVQAGAIKAILEIATKHIEKKSKILEIGSNELDEQGLSYLARLLPKKHLANLTYSDYISSVVNQEALKTERAYECLDLRKPKQSFFGTQDCLMAINVADVISHQDLPKIAEGAYQLLKKEGRVIILADRTIEISALCDKFSQRSDFAFPWTEDISCNMKATLLKGMKVISVDALRKVIETWGTEYKSFIEKLIALTPSQRQYFFQKAFFGRLKLCQFLQLISEGQCQAYERNETYQTDVTSAFESKKFETIFSGYIEGSDVGDHPDSDYVMTNGQFYNKLIYDPRNGGPLVGERIDGIQSGKAKLTAIFHVMVFKKKD